MNFSDQTAPLPLLGGVVEPQRLVVPHEVVRKLETYRDACRLAWDLRRNRHLTMRTLAELANLYAPHVSEYFSARPDKRELPARHIAAVERVIGNTIISQWLAMRSELTVIEELQLQRRCA